MKHRMLYVASFSIIIVLLLSLVGCNCLRRNYAFTIYANWKIKLPFLNKCEEIFSMSVPSFHGDGPRYHVFEYSDEDEISTALPWTIERTAGCFRQSLDQEVSYLLDDLGVSGDIRPNFDNCLYWYHGDREDELILLWDNFEDMVYVIEFFL